MVSLEYGPMRRLIRNYVATSNSTVASSINDPLQDDPSEPVVFPSSHAQLPSAAAAAAVIQADDPNILLPRIDSIRLGQASDNNTDQINGM